MKIDGASLFNCFWQMRVNIIHDSFSYCSYNFPESSRNLRIKLGEANASTIPEPILT